MHSVIYNLIGVKSIDNFIVDNIVSVLKIVIFRVDFVIMVYHRKES